MQETQVRFLVGKLRSHRPLGNQAQAPQLLSSRASTRDPTRCKLQSQYPLEPVCHNYKDHRPCSPCTTTREKTHTPQLEKSPCAAETVRHNARSRKPQRTSCVPQLRPNTAKKIRKINTKKSLKYKNLKIYTKSQIYYFTIFSNDVFWISFQMCT